MKNKTKQTNKQKKNMLNRKPHKDIRPWGQHSKNITLKKKPQLNVILQTVKWMKNGLLSVELLNDEGD